MHLLRKLLTRFVYVLKNFSFFLQNKLLKLISNATNMGLNSSALGQYG